MLVAQSCLTLCNPMDYSPPGSSVHGILQARMLQWVAMAFFRGSSQPRDQTHFRSLYIYIIDMLYYVYVCHHIRSDQSLSRVRLFATP